MTIKLSAEQSRALNKIEKFGPGPAFKFATKLSTLHALEKAGYVTFLEAPAEWSITDAGRNFLHPMRSVTAPADSQTIAPNVRSIDRANTRCPCCGGSGHSNDVSTQTKIMTNTEWKFNVGDRVRKVSGARWQGYVVGFYSTSLTPRGYAVESENEPGSVQIYPEKALEAVKK